MNEVHRSISIVRHLCVHTVWKPVNDWFDQKQWLNVSTRGFQPQPSQTSTKPTTTATALAINTTTTTKADWTQSTKANCDRCQYSIEKQHTTDFDGKTWVQALHIDWSISVFVRKRKRQAHTERIYVMRCMYILWCIKCKNTDTWIGEQHRA